MSGTAIKCQTCVCLLRCKTNTIPTTSSTARISAPTIQVIAKFVVPEVEDEVDVGGFDAVAVAAAAVVTLSDSWSLGVGRVTAGLAGGKPSC